MPASTIATDVRGALKTALSGISANIYDSVPEAPIVPAIICIPDSPYMELEVLGKSTTRVKLNYTVTATTKLVTAFKTLPSTSNQATYALSNLSRVAQDAPYGFIGIANNLNPLLESFQRLSKDAGGAGGALKAMASGLMGPAGIGLALGAVSSILVAFGPKIADFISGTNEATKAEDKFAQSLSDARAEASETGIRLQAYLTITQNASVSDERRAEALKAVKNELSKVNSAYASTITRVSPFEVIVNAEFTVATVLL